MAQVRDQAVYQASDVLLLRAAARSLDSAFVPWPDPADAEELRMWLVKAWQDPLLREAVSCASPSLALRADRIAGGRGVPERQVRSAAVALARYQLRAAGRPTPFGLFAGYACVDHAIAPGGGKNGGVARRGAPMSWTPCLLRSADPGDRVPIRLGDPLVDQYLEFVAARCRPNTVLASAYDLKVFFSVVAKEPSRVSTADVFAFLSAQRAPRRGSGVVRLEDGEAGLSARTIKRRLASVSGLFAYLLARDDVDVRRNPVPRGLATRSPQGRGMRGVPLLRTPRTLPRVLAPAEVDALLGALRTHRDRAMVLAMLLGGLRRCEVLGLRMQDVQAGDRRLFIAEGKGGHQRVVPVSGRFSPALAGYFAHARPEPGTDRVFVVLRGPTRGGPLTAEGVDQVLTGARDRAGLDRATCHQLRHTCLTRLREAGMALEAVQAQAGHRSIESTRVYLHLANGWLGEEYARAVTAIEDDAAREQGER